MTGETENRDRQIAKILGLAIMSLLAGRTVLAHLRTGDLSDDLLSTRHQHTGRASTQECVCMYCMNSFVPPTNSQDNLQKVKTQVLAELDVEKSMYVYIHLGM